ncbi:MAG: hypothetical protein ACI8QS_002922 [Planctomycetota bacterium]|jgi:hypothetical protein
MTLLAERHIDRLGAQYGRLARYAALPEERLIRVHPKSSNWSPAQHLFHVLLANEMSLKNAESLVARKGMLIRPFGSLSPGAEAIIARGRIPRGAAESPRFVRPRDQVDLSFVRDLVKSTLAQIKALDAGAVEDAPDCVPHQILGDLSAAQWLRFARMHTAHHLVIVRELLAA